MLDLSMCKKVIRTNAVVTPLTTVDGEVYYWVEFKGQTTRVYDTHPRSVAKRLVVLV